MMPFLAAAGRDASTSSANSPAYGFWRCHQITSHLDVGLLESLSLQQVDSVSFLVARVRGPWRIGLSCGVTAFVRRRGRGAGLPVRSLGILEASGGLGNLSRGNFLRVMRTCTVRRLPRDVDRRFFSRTSASANGRYRPWRSDRKSTRLNSSHS